MLLLLFFLSLLLLASLTLCSLLPFWARAVVFSMASTPCWSCGSLPAPRLVSRRCSVSPGSAPMQDALAFIFFGTSSFSLPVFSFFPFLGTCHRVQPVQLSVLVSRLSACSLPGFEALFCIAWVGADAMSQCDILLRVLLARTSVPTAISSPLSRSTGSLYLRVIDLAPRGKGGMVASAEEAESSASSASSSDRPSAVLLIVSPPRGLLAWVS